MAEAYVKADTQLANASANTVYTAPTLDSAIITHCTAYKTHNSNVTLTATTAGLQHVNRILPAGRTIVLSELVGKKLASTDAITFTPDVAAVVNIALTIREIAN